MNRATEQVTRLGFIYRICIKISGKPDLNRRPQVPQTCTLTNCAIARFVLKRHHRKKSRATESVLINNRKIITLNELSVKPLSAVFVPWCFIRAEG